MQLFVLQRENKMNTSDTFTKPTTLQLHSDGAHKVHKCTSNISLYCGFKELSVKGLITAMHIKCTSAQVHTVT